ncbi:uncharacterized protein [Lepeophtheirus salmonis]|uniref:uncharacterized protein n=1 Tax=Lepeophtheirus salmonis TaxID=72036 RepID=UPI001AE1062B|nr:zinc finger protein 26-like [Lepeophtheirus salmonis]
MEVELHGAETSSPISTDLPSKTHLVRDSSFIKDEISHFFRHESFADVTIRFSDGELRGHRIVLASVSNYLKKILSPFEEAILELPDFSISEGRLLFDRIYGLIPHSEIIEPQLSPLVETLKLHRALPEEIKAILRRTSFEDSDVSEPEDDAPVETLLKSTYTVAHRRSNNAIKKCIHCNSSWDDDLKLKNHILIDHNAVVQCSDCELHFDEYAEFEAHREEHYYELMQQELPTPPLVETKPVVKKRKKTTSPKKVPIKTTTPVKTGYRPTSPGAFKCEHCPDKIFESQTILDYHKLRHADSSDSFCCLHCDRKFNSEKGLKYHMNKHEGVADFLCDDCGSRFITRQKLLNHRRSKHTFERPYVCETCGDAFTRSDKLIVHIRRAHTGEKPYQCEYCEWRGVDSSALIHHKKKHGPDKMTKTIKRYVHMPQN